MQGKGKFTYITPEQKQQMRRRQLRNWGILVAVVIGVLILIRVLVSMGNTSEITAAQLPCYAGQDVTPMGENVLYYDGASIHCLSGTGAIRWSYPVGDNASFNVSDTHMVAWVGSQLYIVDANGRPTYNESLAGEIQFARVSANYVAVVIGSDTDPELLVKDLTGAQVDDETFSGLILMDCGFYGDQGQYMWVLSMDVYGTAPNTILNTYQVGKMNTGEASLGESITYGVLYENSKLRVFNTRQMYTYDYRAVQDVNGTLLVYGWRLIDSYLPDRGDALMLLAPTAQTDTATDISELRLLSGVNNDRRYTLPSTCVGATVRQNAIYAISGQYVYKTALNTQRFYAYEIPIPDGAAVTDYLGVTTAGRVIVACGDSVYTVSLPE